MTPRTLRDLATRLGATLHADPDAMATGFATDSRDVHPGDLFLAIRGARSDGHAFVPTATAAGAVASVVEQEVGQPHLLVESLIPALARMAATFRAEFTGPVVGITGSAGKTTAKELTAAALSPLGSVLKSEGNRNTEFTSPLVWADVGPTHRAAVIEMGMRGFGQIAHLASFSRPTIALITNVGYAHLELVGSRAGIARAKSELLEALPPEGVALLWQGDEFLPDLQKSAPGRTATFGLEQKADCSIREYRALDWQSAEVSGVCYGKAWRALIPAVGKHIALSAGAAILAAVEAGVDASAAACALAATKFAPMRMEIRDRAGVRILLDTYNASPPSMTAALETFSELPVLGRRLAVIGEMRELGDFSDEAHRQLGRDLASGNLDAVVFFGEPTSLTMKAAEEAGVPAERLRFAQTIDEVRAFIADARAGDAVLIKGSRSLELERSLE